MGGFRDSDNLQIMRNPNNMTPGAKCYTYLAKGHPEEWNDACRNNIYSFYKYISEGKILGKDSCDFATFEDAHYIVKLTEAILKSNQSKSWVTVE